MYSLDERLTAGEHSNRNVQNLNSWTEAAEKRLTTTISCSRNKDLLYSMKVDFIITCIVLFIKLLNSFVFRNGTSILQPALILSIVSLIFPITHLHQVVDKPIINMFGDFHIFVNAVQL